MVDAQPATVGFFPLVFFFLAFIGRLPCAGHALSSSHISTINLFNYYKHTTRSREPEPLGQDHRARERSGQD